MNTVLCLNCSIQGDNSHSRQLSNKLLERIKKTYSSVKIVSRDLVKDSLPHLNGAQFNAFITPPEQRTSEQKVLASQSDDLIKEISDADTVVLALPMYNFGIPSQLKSYFDNLARAGVTFKYTATGPLGLLTGKKSIVLATRGGLYFGTDKDTQTKYVKDFLSFIGITDVEFIYAEGLAISPEQKVKSLELANDIIEAMSL
ncbi:FMN-dependent NADH-azoreductase [Polynucleobacter wuianus]|uniref:FMN dependent NADH:quinone oxidoreductase n=1 Tax=Polynucleobacter wuianus TaxID=1743168 RepID=A0A191UGI4_9BURK|nr:MULTISPECIES: NAD(P)H-dependent oxidoreductase [Polynucleobacter]ANJ00114.1 FMN-dependent NADH-azoreductase [Polynucleobacter wuianus]MBU3553547.1 NAD(P)H-dependent oxidoreductase [Polynucleobacter sp. MWH-Post4-6-1]